MGGGEDKLSYYILFFQNINYVVSNYKLGIIIHGYVLDLFVYTRLFLFWVGKLYIYYITVNTRLLELGKQGKNVYKQSY